MTNLKSKILIVDDNRLNLKYLQDILDSEYEIFTAASGTQALSIVGDTNVDLILLDVIMPDMNGYEVCKKLKSNPDTMNIPVIFVSAMRNVEDETKGLEAGAIDYIFKPFNPAIIKIRVKNHIELKKYRDMLERASHIDGLTGLANRRYFDEVFDKEWRRALRTGDNLSVILLDIDFFKKYNDYYGHLAGDDCLRKVGYALKDCVIRGGDFVARFGGEEFMAILPSTSVENTLLLAEKVRRNIESLEISHQMSEVSKFLTISVGVASVIPNKDMLPESLIEKADNALYQAKNSGRNKIQYYIDTEQTF